MWKEKERKNSSCFEIGQTILCGSFSFCARYGGHIWTPFRRKLAPAEHLSLYPRLTFHFTVPNLFQKSQALPLVFLTGFQIYFQNRKTLFCLVLPLSYPPPCISKARFPLLSHEMSFPFFWINPTLAQSVPWISQIHFSTPLGIQENSFPSFLCS